MKLILVTAFEVAQWNVACLVMPLEICRATVTAVFTSDLVFALVCRHLAFGPSWHIGLSNIFVGSGLAHCLGGSGLAHCVVGL